VFSKYSLIHIGLRHVKVIKVWYHRVDDDIRVFLGVKIEIWTYIPEQMWIYICT